MQPNKLITNLTLSKMETTTTAKQGADILGVSLVAAKAQYAECAAVLKEMYEKAARTGKSVNGYTAAQLQGHFEKYKSMSI